MNEAFCCRCSWNMQISMALPKQRRHCMEGNSVGTRLLRSAMLRTSLPMGNTTDKYCPSRPISVVSDQSVLLLLVCLITTKMSGFSYQPNLAMNEHCKNRWWKVGRIVSLQLYMFGFACYVSGFPITVSVCFLVIPVWSACWLFQRISMEYYCKRLNSAFWWCFG